MRLIDPLALRKAAHVLHTGGVIAYPTEAVFGLGCDPRNERAARRLLIIKRRSATKGLIMIASTFEQLEPFLEPLDTASRIKLETTWPGPVTWLVSARRSAPLWLRGHHDTLAVRVTAHPLAAALCYVWGGPLISTSANLSGRPPARHALIVRKQFGRQVDYIVPGHVGGARRPSEIRDLCSGRVIRAG